MTNEELLVEISSMINPLRENMQGMQGDIRELKQEVGGLKQEVGGLKQEVGDLKHEVQELKVRVKKIEITQENEILPRLNTIESCYISTYDRYRDSIEDYGIMKQDISILKKVVAEHSEKLQKIG